MKSAENEQVYFLATVRCCDLGIDNCDERLID